MRLRAALLPSSPVATLLSLNCSGNLTVQGDPATVYGPGGLGTAQFINTGTPSIYAWALFDQPLLNPLIVVKATLSLFNADGNALTATGKIYIMSAPWNPATLTWNTQPSFPTDPDLISTARIQPGLSGGAPSSLAAAGLNFSIDLRKKSPPLTAYGLALSCQIDQGAQNIEADFGPPQISIMQIAQLQSIGVTNRQCDGAGNITLTLSAPHNLKPGAQIQVSSVGVGYDTVDATYGTPVYVSCDTGTAGSTIKYTYANFVTENIISGGAVLFPATGL